MNYRLLLVNGQGEATTSELRVRTLREFPGLDGLSVHFRPVRNDLLFESAKFGGHLAYRILSGEGIVRSQLWVEYEVLGEHLNVMGRSSDLLFALALITSKWKLSPVKGATVAATGVLDAQGAVLSVERTAEKLAAAVRDLGPAANAIVFYPAADAQGVEAWSAANKIPAHLELRPVANLDDALAQLGYVLEKVYLRNPFRGLEHFDYEHHSIFFGRDGEVREVVKQLLRREAAGVPGLLIEGPSGSGKSSFLRAGVLPALVDPRHQPEEVQAVIRARPVSPGLRGAIWRPGLMPSAADEPAIVRSIQESWAALPEWAADWRASRVETLAQLAATSRTCWPATMRFVWVVDQLEELFTVRLQSGALEALGRFLGQLQNDGAWTLASIRVDAIPQLKQHQALRTVFGANEGQYYLATLKGLALEDVINLPAKAADLTFGIGPDGQRLEQLLREEAYREPDSLPQLQFTLNELYLNRSGNELRYATYQHLGGLSGSIATRAETILKSDTPDSQQTSRRLFRNLVSVDETGRAARRYAPMTELAEDPAQTALVVRLIQARLCVTDERDGQPVVAFSHDSLLRTLPSLIDWLQEEAALLQTRELVQREARLWQQNRRSDAWLAAADKLVAFQALEAAYITLPAEVRDFIDRSRRYARRATRIRQAAMSVIALLALAASIGAWIGLKKEREAEYQTQQTLAAQARLLTDAAAQRLKAADLGAAQGIILEVLRNPLFAVHRTAASIALFQEARAADPQRAVLGGHGDVARFAAYSPDGTRIVSASYDKTARIWDAHTGAALAVLSGHKDRVFFAAYSPDGTRVVTASADRTARIWNAQTGAQLAVVQGHTGGFNSAVFSPDGTRILTASGDKNAQLWDARTGVLLASISGHSDVVGFARFSPDGTRLVTASNDRTARIWDARTGAQLTMLSGHDSIVYTASYSPDGSRIVTSSSDKTARIWNARTGAQLAVLSGHGGAVYSAAYSPDGTRIVTASFDRTVRIWDSQTSRQLATIAGFGERVCSAMYSPDGDRIVTASFDRTVRIWDAQTGGAQLRVLSGAGDRLNYAAYSPDGTRIVIASNDKTARILDARTGALLAVLSGHRGLVAGASYSPDSARIVTASYDNTARIWDGHTGALLSTLSGHAGQIESAVYSPDGTRIVTASYDKTARIWDASTNTALAVLSGHTNFVVYAAYSHDGTRVVTASFDKTARIWNARTGAQLAVLSGHAGSINTAVYSPDGSRIVTASLDKTARIWDAQTGEQLTLLSGHNDRVQSAAYSPDGTRIVTASDDKTARIWDARTGVQLAVLSGHEDALGSAAYSPDGSRILTASYDKTARVWDAHVPANLDAQILWEAAAQTDPLSDVDRTQLGLLPDARERKWRTPGSACDQAAAAFYDPDRLAPGLSQATIVADVAISACSPQTAEAGNSPRLVYERGRALRAKSDVTGAKQQFELAASTGYRAAQIDQADLLVSPTAEMADPERAASLYEKAWQDGVPIAAFELGHLYEFGVSGADATAPGKFQPNMAKAWYWYKEGADMGEPDALARFAERDETDAVRETDRSKRNAFLLQAFRFYTAAAERAHDEDWPVDAWRHWRYRRATLARVLALEGMMQEVAAAYDTIRKSGDAKSLAIYTAAIAGKDGD